MSTARTDLMRFLMEMPGLDNAQERKALITFAGYPFIGLYLDWSGAQVQFAEALIDELSRRGQNFTVQFLKDLANAPQVSVDRQETLQGLQETIATLPAGTWQQDFPVEPFTEEERTALAADPDMLAAAVVSNILLPYYELGPEEMEGKAGARAAGIAAKTAESLESSFAADPVASTILGLFKEDPKKNEASLLKVTRDALEKDGALAGDLAGILTAQVLQEEDSMQAMVNISQDIRTVKGDVVGVIVGDEVLGSIGVQQDIDTVESGGTVVGAVYGEVGTIGGQHRHGPTYEEGSTHEERHIDTGGGDNIDVGDISGSTGIAIGRNASASVTQTQGISGAELVELFEKANAMIGQAQINPDYDRDEVEDTTKRIEKEVAKGDSADVGKVERRLKNLLDMAPDVAQVVIAGLADPMAGAAMAVTKLAQRLQRSLD